MVEQCQRAIDTNKDGQISFEEFLMWWLSGKEGTGKYKLPSLEDSSSAKFFNYLVRELEQIASKTKKL